MLIYGFTLLMYSLACPFFPKFCLVYMNYSTSVDIKELFIQKENRCLGVLTEARKFQYCMLSPRKLTDTIAQCAPVQQFPCSDSH